MRSALAVVFTLVLLGCASAEAKHSLIAVGPGVSPVAPMHIARAAHSATLLRDGTVLVVGGCTGDSCETTPDGASTEIFDPRSERFSGGPGLPEPRVGHTATRLRDGSVLIAGGWEGSRVTSNALRYRPAGRVFRTTGSMRVARGGFTATLLRDGRVLLAGGSRNGDVLRSAELYDPRTGRFSSTGRMAIARTAHAAAVLPDGRVLVAGGSNVAERVVSSAEIYNPATGRWARTRAMRMPRHKLGAIAIRGGVLVVGGSDGQDYYGRYASAELFVTRTGRFVAAGTMRSRRYKLPDAVAGLPDGAVLVAGGARQVEVYDPRRRQFRTVGSVGVELSFSTATTLRDGRVLIVGGYDERIHLTKRAWVYKAH